jgi:two-component system chemotaxis response regulator CheB
VTESFGPGGGTQALQEILTRLPQDIPPILITQHIPAGFSRALAERLNNLCPFEVKEAQDGLKQKIFATILTGMGKDGAQGMLELKQKGALTIAQDEASSVVYGMPKEAARIGAADAIKPLLDIPQHWLDLMSKIGNKN